MTPEDIEPFIRDAVVLSRQSKTAEDHRCYESDGYFCIDGQIYGYCDSEFCYGACEKIESCPCPRHDDETKECNAKDQT